MTFILLISLAIFIFAVTLGVTFDFSSLVLPHAFYSNFSENQHFLNPYLFLPIISMYVGKLMIFVYYFSSSINVQIFRVHHRSSKHAMSDTARHMTLAIATVNLLLIAIVNPSLLNPGPSSLVVYQYCTITYRGLSHTGNLASLILN